MRHRDQQHAGEGLLAATSRRNALRGLVTSGIAGSALVLAGRSAWAQNALTSSATEAIARRAISAINQALASGDMSVLDTVFASEYVDHTPRQSIVSGELFSPDLSGLKASLTELRRVVPDAALIVDDVIASGDTASVRGQFRGTLNPDVVNGSSQRLRVGGVTVGRVFDGQVVESWTYHEPVEALEAIATPVPESPADDDRGETREIRDFQAVSLQGAGTLVIEQGDTESLRIEAAPKVLRSIETRVENGTLIIQPDRSFTTREPITYHLTVEQLNEIEVAGAGQVTAEQLTTDELSIQVSGTGAVDIADLTAATLQVTASGNSQVELAGNVENQTVMLTGAAWYEAADLQSRLASVTVGGASEATVHVSKHLDANVTEAGSIAYIGDPRVSKDVSIAGNLTKVG